MSYSIKVLILALLVTSGNAAQQNTAPTFKAGAKVLVGSEIYTLTNKRPSVQCNSRSVYTLKQQKHKRVFVYLCGEYLISAK